MTTRERKEARLARRREWAESRDKKATASFLTADRISERFSGGQPILVGHHSEAKSRHDQARMHEAGFKGLEHTRAADHHRQTADGIEAQLATSIYSDDADAIEALELRISEREAERSRIKAYNLTCRKAAKEGRTTGDLSLLSEDQRRDLLLTARVAAYQLRPGGAFPSYVLSNLSSRIKSDRDRILDLRRLAERRIEAENAPGGLVIRRNPEYDMCTVRFAEKPSREVIDALKGAGFGFLGGAWSGRLSALPAMIEEMAK